MKLPGIEGIYARQKAHAGMPFKVSGVMVFSESDLRRIKVALQSQLDRERRVLSLMEQAQGLVEGAWWHRGQLEEQQSVVAGYEELLQRVSENA